MTSRLTLGIGCNLLDAIFGYAVVFIGLTLLMTVIVIVGKVFTAKKAAPAEEKAAPAADPVSAACHGICNGRAESGR